jgi:hypothetical protein
MRRLGSTGDLCASCEEKPSIAQRAPRHRLHTADGFALRATLCHTILINIGHPTHHNQRAIGQSGMDKFIARANIAHYCKKLATEADETKRQMLLRRF